MEELKHWDELGLTSMNCIMEARSQYLSAEEIELARVLTIRLSGSLILSGFYNEVMQLNAELLDYEKHPSSMIWMARAYSDQGNYDSAHHWYQCSLRASGDSDLKEIAASWHGLATIDLMKYDYDAAYEKFQKSLEIDKVIGDRAGVATTFLQLGILAWDQGRVREGLQLVALCCFMVASIGMEMPQAISKSSPRWHRNLVTPRSSSMP